MHQLEVNNQKVMQETILKFHQQTEQLLESKKKLLQRLAERFSSSDPTKQPQQLHLDLRTYLRDFNHLDYIGVIDNKGGIYYSDAQNDIVKQWYDTYVTSQYPLVSTKPNTNKSTNATFYYNDQVDHTFIVVPLAQSETVDLSSIVTAINLKRVMQSTVNVVVPKGYFIKLAYENKTELLVNQLDPQHDYYLVGHYEVNSLNAIKWKLKLYQDFDNKTNYLVEASGVTFIAGWLACLFALLSQQYQTQIQRQKKRLIVKNKKLLNSLTLQKKLQMHHLQFMANSADLLCIIDADGAYLEVSNSISGLLGYSKEEVKGRPFMELVHPEDRQITANEAKSVISGQNTQCFRNRYVHKDGTAVHLMWSAKYVARTQTLYGVGKNISAVFKAERYQNAQQQILQLISVEEPLAEILKQICLMAEEHNPAIKACVMSKVDEELRIASAPSLSDQFHQALGNVPITDSANALESAVFQNNLVIVENIATAPKWRPYADSVLADKLHACWSLPLLLHEGDILGMFAFYCKNARAPSSEELKLMDSCCRLAANAIERSQQKRMLIQSEQRFKSLYQFNPDPVYVCDERGYFLNVNNPGCELLGWSSSELNKMHFSQFILNERLLEVSKYFSSALSGEAKSFETSIISRSGTEHELHVIVIPTWIDGNVTGVIGLVKDITQRLQTERQLRLFKRAVDASSNGVVITDITQLDMPISYVNYGFENITGYNEADVVGKNCRFLQGKERDELALEQIRSAITEKREISVVLKNYRKDGRAFWNNLFLSPVPDELGTITHYIGIQTDITEQRKYEKELAYNTSHDLLTGLPNRSLLLDRLSQSININARHKEKVAILFIDLDGFHLINDSLGHLIGDEVIRQVSTRISSQIRLGDTLARMGGDEFVLLIPDLKDIDQLNVTAERVLAIISTPFEIDDQKLQLTASIGISIVDGEIKQPAELVRQADLAMYQAKQLGRNNAQWYNLEMEATFNKRLDFRAMLKQALVNKEFELYYQPQVEAGSERLIGLEALLRWRHPELGLIGPDEFIPIAEEMGLIVEIGQWVIEQAAAYNYSLQERGLAEIVMAVNLSSLQFQREGFVKQLEKTLNEAKLAPKWFELELTESLLLANIEQVVQKLQDIKRLGVSIAIDDFGTGFSSLSYLKRLPIDRLKIDKSFVRELVTNHKDGAIIRAIIAMAHQLGLKVIAEGVETVSQTTLLHKMLCDELQGYFFSKPLPVDTLETFLRDYLPARNSKANPGLQTLLLVDDEENILHSLKRILRKEAFNILTCNSAAEAFELLASHNVQVIVSDQRMPEMSGTEFLSQVKDMYPDTVRLVLSGYTDLRSVTDAINHGAIYKFITKPWQDDDLREEILSAFRLYKQQLNKK
jgi:diguanylate cyclase (GGDEF)-like protein/PAS domain S-box-containing protein